MGSHVVIDDFVFVDGSGGLEIGSHVHVAAYASLWAADGSCLATSPAFLGW